MNSDSCGPRRAGEDPVPSARAYCRRLPYRSCSALTAGVNTKEPKLWDIVSFRSWSHGPQRTNPMPPWIAASGRTTQYDLLFLPRAAPAQNGPYPADASRCPLDWMKGISLTIQPADPP